MLRKMAVIAESTFLQRLFKCQKFLFVKYNRYLPLLLFCPISILCPPKRVDIVPLDQYIQLSLCDR